MSRISKKWAIIATVVIVAMGGAAFAFWTQNGSGSGTETTGTTTAITVNQTSTVEGLAPGLPAQALSGDFDNPNAGPVYVASVTAVVTSTSKTGCGADNYTIAGTATVSAEVPSGTEVGAWSGLTIQFNDKDGVNQDVCKNALVTITYTSN